MMKQAWIAIALGTILATGILPQSATAGDVEENIDNRQDRRDDVRDDVDGQRRGSPGPTRRCP